MLRISLRARISFSAHFVQKTQNISFFYTYRCCGLFEADEGAGAGLDLLDPEVSFLTGFEDFPCGFEGWGAGMGSSFSLGISSSARGVDVFMGLPGSESSVYKWVVSESSLGYIEVGVSGLDIPEEDSTSLSWESISFSVGRINLFLDLGGCILKIALCGLRWFKINVSKYQKRRQVVKKMSSCQKDVKCQKMKHLDYGGGSQKN